MTYRDSRHSLPSLAAKAATPIPYQRQRAEEVRQRAEEAQKGLLEERERVKRLMAQLRALGIEPQTAAE